MIIYNLNITLEGNTIDNEIEATDFVNWQFADTRAFLMNMTMKDEEQDCTGVVGSNSMFEFRYLKYCTLADILLTSKFLYKQKREENRGVGSEEKTLCV